MNKGYRFKIPEQGQPSSTTFPHWGTQSFLQRTGRDVLLERRQASSARNGNLYLAKEGPRRASCTSSLFARQAAGHQPWRQCRFIHEAQQADKKVAPPCVSDLKYKGSEAVSSGGTRSSRGGGRGCCCRAISSRDGLALAARPLWPCQDTPAAPWGGKCDPLPDGCSPALPTHWLRQAMPWIHP